YNMANDIEYILSNMEVPMGYLQEEEEDEIVYDKNNDYKKWEVLPNNTYAPLGNFKTTKKLIPGKYHLSFDSKSGRYLFIKAEMNLDELFVLPEPSFNSILDDIKFFWKNPQKFNEYKYTHKRGILLYGEPGGGKSSLCLLLSNVIIKEEKGIVIYVDNPDDLDLYMGAMESTLRIIEPNTPVLCVIEDLDGLVADKRIESKLLNLLDGNNQLNNVVYVGCTNYPEDLKDRVLNRPSRFDKRYYIGLPNDEVREFYLRKKIKSSDLKNIDISQVVKQTDGLTIAHLGEFIKSVYIFGKDPDGVVEELKGMGDFISSSRYKSNKPKTGFGR
ncbi:MAG: AAA family ATPase, partial [bacterium]